MTDLSSPIDLGRGRRAAARTARRAPAGGRTSALATAGLIAAPWVAVLAGWWAMNALAIVDPALLPSPLEVAGEGLARAADGRLLADVAASSARVLTGVAIGTSLAVPIGIALGRFEAMRLAVGPLVGFFRALPPIALIPLVIIYFGIGEAAKVIVLSFAAFFGAVIVIYEGVSQIAPIYTHVARTLGASEQEIFRRVTLPLAVPHVLTGLRVALGVTWATLVAAELVAAQTGLGASIQVAASFFQLPVIYVGIIAIGVTALAMDVVLKRLTVRAVAWQERLER
jgi:NitT/TauT family transport system permease protein